MQVTSTQGLRRQYFPTLYTYDTPYDWHTLWYLYGVTGTLDRQSLFVQVSTGVQTNAVQLQQADAAWSGIAVSWWLVPCFGGSELLRGTENDPLTWWVEDLLVKVWFKKGKKNINTEIFIGSEWSSRVSWCWWPVLQSEVVSLACEAPEEWELVFQFVETKTKTEHFSSIKKVHFSNQTLCYRFDYWHTPIWITLIHCLFIFKNFDNF